MCCWREINGFRPFKIDCLQKHVSFSLRPKCEHSVNGHFSAFTSFFSHLLRAFSSVLLANNHRDDIAEYWILQWQRLSMVFTWKINCWNYFTFKLNIDSRSQMVSARNRAIIVVHWSTVHSSFIDAGNSNRKKSDSSKLHRSVLLECNGFGRKHVFDMSRQVSFFTLFFSSEMVLNLITHAYTRRSIHRAWIETETVANIADNSSPVFGVNDPVVMAPSRCHVVFLAAKQLSVWMPSKKNKQHQRQQ